MPVRHHLTVNRSGQRIDHLRRVAIRPGRRKHRLPDVPLLGGAPARAQHVLIGVLSASLRNDRSIRFAVGRNRHLAKIPLAHKRVGVLVEINVLVGMEIHRIGTRHPRAVVKVGIENLRRRRFPSARRSAECGPRPSLADAAILLLDRRNQLVVDGSPVRPHVGRIHVVGVVVVRVRVLDVNQDHARQPARSPILVELVAGLLPSIARRLRDRAGCSRTRPA